MGDRKRWRGSRVKTRSLDLAASYLRWERKINRTWTLIDTTTWRIFCCNKLCTSVPSRTFIVIVLFMSCPGSAAGISIVEPKLEESFGFRARFYGNIEAHFWSLPGNVHRGMHTLSMRSTEAFEGARKKVANFVNGDVHEPCPSFYTLCIVCIVMSTCRTNWQIDIIWYLTHGNMYVTCGFMKK